MAVSDDINLGILLKRFEKQILSFHNGHQVERYRIRTLKRNFGSLRLIHMTAKEVALTSKAPAICADTDSLVKLSMVFATFGSEHLPDNGPIRRDFD